MSRLFFLSVSLMLISCNEGEVNPFLIAEEPVFETQTLFDGQRFPNIAVTREGTILAVWGGISEQYGTGSLQVRRSSDGGKTWSDTQVIKEPIQWNGGGVIADRESGDILLFAETGPLTPGYPAGTLSVFRSEDDGISWEEQDEVTILPNSLGHIPSMHISEHGITLQHGEYAGRLLRATRYYSRGNEQEFWPEHYTNAMYSDDGGYTWQASEPFPAYGTGEAAVAELGDGTIYYNSRRHLSTDGLNPRMRHIAYSRDGGRTWQDLSVSDVLPDGSQHRDYGLMAGLVRLPVYGHDILLFSNIESDDGRNNGTVWASFDGGKTWPVKRVIDAGGFAYSSLAAGINGTPGEGYIYLLYEDGGHPDSEGKVVRFNMAWLTEGKQLKEYLK